MGVSAGLLFLQRTPRLIHYCFITRYRASRALRGTSCSARLPSGPHACLTGPLCAMFSSSRGKRRLRESPSLRAQPPAATANDQKGQAHGKKTLQLALPTPASPLGQYYPGTSIPMNGWFHACKICRCWTAFCASDTGGQAMPLCRRCAPHHSKGLQLRSVFDSDTASDEVHQREATAVQRATLPQQLPAPAAAPASLADHQSPTANAAGFLSPGFNSQSLQPARNSSQAGSLQQHFECKHDSTQIHSAPGHPAAATAVPSKVCADSLQRGNMPGVSQPHHIQQQQQQWMQGPWAEEQPGDSEPQIKSRRCSDVGPSRSSSLLQAPFFSSQGLGLVGSHVNGTISASMGANNLSAAPPTGGSPGAVNGLVPPQQWARITPAHAGMPNAFATVAGAAGSMLGSRASSGQAKQLGDDMLGAIASLLGHWYSSGVGAEADVAQWQQDYQLQAYEHQQQQQQIEVGEQFLYQHQQQRY